MEIFILFLQFFFCLSSLRYTIDQKRRINYEYALVLLEEIIIKKLKNVEYGHIKLNLYKKYWICIMVQEEGL